MPYTPELVAHYLERSFRLGDTVRPGPQEGSWWVRSATDPRKWWLVTDAGCGCPGYHYRGHCRHFVRAAWQEQNVRRARQGLSPIPAPSVEVKVRSSA